MEEQIPSTTQTTPSKEPSALLLRVRRPFAKLHDQLRGLHHRTPYLGKLPLPAILIIALLIFVNLVVWAICGLILAFHSDNHMLGTAALAYSLGLRHALDADHISAIDLMTRRLIATGQRPVTVGTYFSLGHSTIVIITSIVVAATAAGVSSRFDGFSNVGGIIGTSVSAAFLLLLGMMNAYILYKLIVQIRHVIDLSPTHAAEQGWKVEGGGLLFRILKKMFKLIDRPWKMYPLGVLFGLGFDTSSEIALLGISSIQGARGTSFWLILIFPVLFTSGMCLVDTTDGALMMALYVAPMGLGGGDKKYDETAAMAAVEPEFEAQGRVQNEALLAEQTSKATRDQDPEAMHSRSTAEPNSPPPPPSRVKDPLTFLYYSIVLTTLTVICAIVIGVLQLLSLILNVAHPTGPFWDGVAKAGDSYEIIGGAICGSFIVAGVVSVLGYRFFKRKVEERRRRLGVLGERDEGGVRDSAGGKGRGAGRDDEGSGDGGEVGGESVEVDDDENGRKGRVPDRDAKTGAARTEEREVQVQRPGESSAGL